MLDGLIAAASDKRPVDARDRALAREILLGAIRHRASLDLVLAAAARRPVERIDPPVRELLRQAVYQLLMLERVPAHAAVNDAVNLARQEIGKSVVGFVNACLRKAADLQVDRMDGPPPAEYARRSIAGRDGATIMLKRELLPDPEQDRDAWLAAHYSAPQWLIARWCTQFGADETEALLRAALATPPLTVRINHARADEEEGGVEVWLQGCESCEPADEALPDAWRIHTAAPDLLPGFAKGYFTIQDLTAQRTAALVGAARGEQVLDLCAAPGGKTTQLADAVGPDGRVAAVDLDPRRLDRVRENLERLHLDNVSLQAGDGSEVSLGTQFDAALVDVPCSNTGVLGRRPEVRWRVTPEILPELTALQLRLLVNAAEHLAAHGRLVYSTCSLLAEENEQVVAAFLDQHPEWRLNSELLMPARAGVCDGGYGARLVRR
jgi:16S rRNA (cytosine967-C5)-methyltransferase